jgi:hypothetical protein
MVVTELTDETVMFLGPAGTSGSTVTMFKAITGQVVDRSKTIPTHKTEAGYQVSDNVLLNPVKITLTFSLLHNCTGQNEDTGTDEIITMDALVAANDLLTVCVSVGGYQNMLIQDVSYDKTTPTMNTVKCTVTLVEVRTSIAETTTVTLPTLPDDSIPGNSTAVSPAPVTTSGTAVTNDGGPLGYITGFLNLASNSSSQVGQ